MNSLFTFEPIHLQLPDAEITYYKNFFDSQEAIQLFEQLEKTIPWQQDDIHIFGKTHPQPRLTALYGNSGKPYSYSNIYMEPRPWNSLLERIKKPIENTLKTHFTTVLLNLYRNGKDSNGWHADNEKELGPHPIIASVSFGAARTFQLKHNTIKGLHKNIELENGSLLVMKGNTQTFWKHQIPKTSKLVGPRINLTFRILM